MTATVKMKFLLVQPYSNVDRFRRATLISEHDTIEQAFGALDAVARDLARHGISADALEMYVVDEERRKVPRPGAL